jgi:hypothetical protein
MSAPDDKQTLHNPPKSERKLGEDVSNRASRMPKNSSILYRNRTPRHDASPHYRGLLKLENGDTYWVGLWVRQLRGEPVLEIKLTRKEDSQ